MLTSLLAALAVQTSSATPSRILLTMTEKPATSAAVTWRTGASPSTPIGQVVPDSSDPKDLKADKNFAATTTTVTLPKGGTAKYHTVRFTGLKPGTKYTYRVGDGTNWSEWIDFKTAQEKPAPFNFIYFGDAQNDIKSKWSRAVRKAFRDLPYADFMLHAGDLINNANNDEEWDEWFYAGGWIHSQIPSVATPGNHEYSKGSLSKFWKPQFAFPSNGLPALAQTNYFFDYQGARIISLNSNQRIAEQTKWLENNLKNNPNRWTIVTFHHPVYSTAKGRDNAEIRRQWQPIFQKYKVALVLQGHDHSYGRQNVTTGVSGTDHKSGTVYVVSVSGPKMYGLGSETAKTMERRAQNTQLYQIVHVTPEKIRFEAYTISGDLYDACEIIKNATGGQTIKELKPQTKERL